MITYYKDTKNGLANCEKWEPNCWINIEIPTENEKKAVLNNYNIPESFYNDIEDDDERPRVEFDEGWFLIILRIPFKTFDVQTPFATIPLGLVFKDNIFASICFHKTELISDFILFTRKKNITISNNIDLTLRLLLSSSIWFLKYLKQINQNIKSAENELHKSIRNEELHSLLHIEKCLVYFTTSLKGNDILIYRIKNLKNYKGTIDMELIEDVEIELRQALEMTNIYSDILSGMMDAYASVISNNMNIIMKQLTAISIILMIPTVVASFYGMNVPNFLENNHFGFWIVILISFILSSFGVFVFMRRKWF